MKGSAVGSKKVEANSRSSAANGGDNVTVLNTSTQVVPASSRRAVMMFNDSDETIYVAYGKAAELNKGGRLNANGGYIREEMFKGAINAISQSGSKNLTFIVI